ncbi:hypothetical protein ABIB08_003554 [Bradyrhizobium sp. RT11b]
MNLILGATTYDRLFLGVTFDEVADRILYVFARTKELAAEIEENYALYRSSRARSPGSPLNSCRCCRSACGNASETLTASRSRVHLPGCRPLREDVFFEGSARVADRIDLNSFAISG